MTIEEEFYKAFGVSKVRECELREKCFMGFAHTCKECNIYGQAYEVYPPITPEIMLGLEEILLEVCRIKTINSNRFYYYISKIKSFSGTYGVAIQHKENDEIIGGYHNWGNNSTEALLKLCIEIQPEIQDQVRQLFK